MAPQLRVHLDGSATAFRTAERGVLFISVTSSTESQETSLTNVQETSQALTELFRSHAHKTDDGKPHPDAGITTFTVSALSTSATFPKDKHCQVILNTPGQYAASTLFEVSFRDLKLLGQTANELSKKAHASITKTEWRLTDATKEELKREARKKAMENAVQKANDYAGVVGRKVVAVHISDHSARYEHAACSTNQYSSQSAQDHNWLENSKGPSVEPKTIAAAASVSVQFVSEDGEGMEKTEKTEKKTEKKEIS